LATLATWILCCRCWGISRVSRCNGDSYKTYFLHLEHVLFTQYVLLPNQTYVQSSIAFKCCCYLCILSFSLYLIKSKMSILHKQQHWHIYFNSQFPHLPGLAIDLQRNLRDYRNGILFIWWMQHLLGLRAMHSETSENRETCISTDYTLECCGHWTCWRNTNTKQMDLWCVRMLWGDHHQHMHTHCFNSHFLRHIWVNQLFPWFSDSSSILGPADGAGRISS